MLAGVLRAALLIWTGLTFLPAWLVMIRGLFDGEAYSWGFSERIRGSGAGGSYPIIPPLVLYGLTLLALGWRGARRPFHVLLMLWHLPLGIAASLATRRNREALRLQGDTLGIDISLADIAPAVLGGIGLSAALLAALDGASPPGTRRPGVNKRLLGIAIGVMPIQFALLRTGKQHGLTDKLGVILTICQWTLINLGLRGRR
jgi:hypothetical protein